MKALTQGKVEGLRGELFHMILFAMAWVFIGEYSFNFKDYAVPGMLVLLMVVWLAIHSIKLYELEDSLPEDSKGDQLSFSNILIPYGCAAGAVADGIGVMARTWKSIYLP